MAENGSVETPFGAPVVHELPPDPGPHERLITVRAVAARLGLSLASVYKLCERGQLRGLRIGGALRFSPQLIDQYIARCAAGAAGPTAPPSPQARIPKSCQP